MVDSVLQKLEALRGICEIQVLNFSVHKHCVITKVQEWLGLTHGMLTYPKASRVNRSLTRGEIIFQMALNRDLGHSAALLADPLCEKLPNIEADLILPAVAVQKELLDRLQPTLDRVNSRMAPTEHYTRDVIIPTKFDSEIKFSEQQAELIANQLASEIARLRLTCNSPQDAFSFGQLFKALAKKVLKRVRRGPIATTRGNS